MKWNSQFNALLNIMRTLFIVVALAAATLLFNRDSDRLVLRPIERMIKKASRILACASGCDWASKSQLWLHSSSRDPADQDHARELRGCRSCLKQAAQPILANHG